MKGGETTLSATGPSHLQMAPIQLVTLVGLDGDQIHLILARLPTPLLCYALLETGGIVMLEIVWDFGVYTK